MQARTLTVLAILAWKVALRIDALLWCSTMNSRPKVIFVGGSGRSGSTLLDLLLGELDGFASIGELRFIWSRGFGENRLCGCGTPFRACEFWSSVIHRAFGNSQPDWRYYAACFDGISSKARLPFLLSRIHPGGLSTQISEYTQAVSALYMAISSISGARVIVDSSKHPIYGILLNNISDIDITVVHLVRDSRAVAYSWQRHRAAPDVHWKHQEMPRFGTYCSVRNWIYGQLLMHALRRQCRSSVFMRYEDLARCPQRTLNTFLSTIGETLALPSLHDKQPLHLNHTVSGNPLRFQRSLDVKPDCEWTTHMPFASKCLVTMLSWPLLLRYGYMSDGTLHGINKRHHERG